MTTPEELPGNPDVVLTAARSYTATAEAVTRAAAQILALSRESSTATSGAVMALSERAGDVADRLTRLHERYAVAGSALSSYSNSLSDIKASSRENAVSYHQAQYAYNHANDQIEYWQTVQRNASDPSQMAHAAEMINSLVQQRNHAHEAMSQAISCHTALVQDRDTAAETAQHLIDVAVDKDGLNDSIWDNIKGWVSENAEFLKKLKTALSWITTGLAVLSLFIPVLAPFALAAAALTAGLSLLLALSGEESWLEFGIDALALVTMGVGAVAGRTVTEAVSGLKGLRIVRVAASGASKSSAARVVTGSFNGVSMGKISLNSLKSLKGLAKLKDVYLYGGVENANAFRVFTRAVAGSGSLDSWALKPGLQALMAIRASQMVDPASRLLDLSTSFDSPLAEGYEKLKGATTLEVGSPW